MQEPKHKRTNAQTQAKAWKIEVNQELTHLAWMIRPSSCWPDHTHAHFLVEVRVPSARKYTLQHNQFEADTSMRSENKLTVSSLR